MNLLTFLSREIIKFRFIESNIKETYTKLLIYKTKHVAATQQQGKHRNNCPERSSSTELLQKSYFLY